jgi:hypothetical protein
MQNKTDIENWESITDSKKLKDNMENAKLHIANNFYETFKDITSPSYLKWYIMITIIVLIITGLGLYPFAYMDESLLSNKDKAIQDWIKLSFTYFTNLGSYFWTAIISMLFQKFINGIPK